MRDDRNQFTWTSDFENFVARMFAEAYAEALVMGDGTGEPRGILDIVRELAEPTPAERALAILDPHLRACPLYNAGPAAIYPTTWKARP
ncbi:hypothetical protein [Streptomyces sp. NPDC091215]|uniref:hypothetical protein n=1 Tax=Streptomyces sp. NPDC091215 TaxID=3155192 RepID=UPI0034161027